MWTYYDVLGVDRDADAEQVRAAYRSRVKEVHPDVSDHPDAEARFRAITRAREVLCDPDERARYDRLGHNEYVDGSRHPDPDDHDTTRSTADTKADARARSAAAETRRTRGRQRAGTRTRRRARRRADMRASMAEDQTTGRRTTDGGTTSAGSTAWGRATSDERGFSVSPGPERREPFTAERTALAIAALICYPAFLAAMFLAPVASSVRVGAGLGAVLLAVVTLAVPEAGLVAFGTLTIIAPFALSATGVGILSLTGIVVWAFCWVPLVVSGANFVALRSGG